MLRQQVLNLYRNILRAVKQVPDKQTRLELHEWARSDFRGNRHHADEFTIKTLINYGERWLKELQTNLNLAK